MLRISGFGSATKIVLHITEFVHDRRLCGAACGFAVNDATRIDPPRPPDRKVNSPNGIGSESHEHIPFLLIPDGTVSLGDLMGVHQFLKTGQRSVVRVDEFGKGQIPPSVFVARIDEGGIRERAQIGQRCVHLRAVPFEETATASDKEGIPSEHHRGSVREGPIRNVVADRILSVTRGCKAPWPVVSKSLRVRQRKNQTPLLDLQRPDGEHISVLYYISDSLDLFAPPIDGYIGKFARLYAWSGK